VTSPIITEAVRALVDRRDLTRLEAASAMEAIMSGGATNAQIAAFLTALRMKGETVEELIGFAQVMRQKAVKVRAHDQALVGQTGTDREMLIDTCGTGGDASGTFNVSTATAFVVAGAGLKVAKHGNRSVSSLCGSADVVETLGISVDLSPQKVARVLAELGTIRAFVVHGADGLDEISNTGESQIAEVHEGVVRSTRVRPEDFGLSRAAIGDLQGGDRQENAEIIRRVLGGEAGPRRDIVLMNAAAALVAGAKARDFKEGVGLAARSIDSGAARGKLEALVALSQRLGSEVPA
jgi:anthranilate phosphoribosyltransferase